MPASIFQDAGLARSTLVTALCGVTLFGTFTFVPLALASGGGSRPDITGLLLLPMSIGQIVFTTGFAVLVRQKPALTGWGRLGISLGVAGMTTLALIPTLSTGATRTILTVIGLGLAGAALGLSMQPYTLIAQARAPRTAIGGTMATLSFTRQIGGAMGIAVFGWVTLLPTGGAGLSVVFVLAAIALAVALVAAPRAEHDLAE